MLQYWRVFILTFAFVAAGAYQLYGTFSNAGYAPKQPIAFSHLLHAGVMQMECLYCHSSAEKGAHAGVPSVDLCMGCHSIVQTASPEIQKLTEYYNNNEPVPWVRIHKLPDHSYFNHKWHIQAGVSCQECHGPIQQMEVVRQWQKLEMKSCMDCHRQDTYINSIYHPPTFHEAPITADELEAVSGNRTLVAASEGSYVPAGWESARREFEKYHGATHTAEEAAVMLNRLKEYKDDKYIHGRGAQLLGRNASIECSTCHY